MILAYIALVGLVCATAYSAYMTLRITKFYRH